MFQVVMHTRIVFPIVVWVGCPEQTVPFILMRVYCSDGYLQFNFLNY